MCCGLLFSFMSKRCVMHHPFLSVIVPVYRVETTLDECVRSIVSQSFADLQLILVDDGSPDACPAMCDSWAKRDGRISVVHKPNGGLSDARNAGIGIAEGELLMFVDSDDILAPDTVKPLVVRMIGHPEIDILEFPVIRVFSGGRCQRLDMKPRRFADMSDYWLKAKAYTHTYAWNKVYRRELFSTVRFPVGKVFEDVWTLPLLLDEARVVEQVPSGCYVYRENLGGITANASAADERSLLMAHVGLLGSRLCPEVKSIYERMYYMHIVDIQLVLCEMTGESPLLPFFKLSIGGLSVAHKLKAMIINILGLRFLCACNYYFRRFFPRKK